MSSEWKKNIEYFLAPVVIPLMMDLFRSLIVVKRINNETYLKYKKIGKPVIFAFWHGRQFLIMEMHKYRYIATMNSYSRDGDMQTKIMEKFKYKVFRGSSGKKGAVQATIQLMKYMQHGFDSVMAVDGPSGPPFVVKPGAIFMAQKTGAIILPTTSSARHKKIFNNWDRYLLPLPVPFNPAVLLYGNPIEVTEKDEIQQKCEELRKELNRIDSLADEIVQK